MNEIFRLYLRQFILVFFDNILIYSSDWSSHHQGLRTALQILQDHSLFVNKSKCRFGQAELVYLGHLISGNEVRADVVKIESMVKWPYPNDVKELQGS